MSERLTEVVEVRWLDSVGDPHWTDTDDALRDANDDDLEHFSAGYLLEQTDRYVLLALSQRADGAKVGDVIQIPAPSVLDVKHVRKARAS